MVVECIDKKLTDKWELHLGKIIHLDNRHLMRTIVKKVKELIDEDNQTS